ncbi:MAG: hypothetical protein LBU14_01355 [Candidatus Peribacteria bacterium]|jgi:hypothetical protein|nr:hypothetical protein [Candidatus Peribacteria bacterium]
MENKTAQQLSAMNLLKGNWLGAILVSIIYFLILFCSFLFIVFFANIIVPSKPEIENHFFGEAIIAGIYIILGCCIFIAFV